ESLIERAFILDFLFAGETGDDVPMRASGEHLAAGRALGGASTGPGLGASRSGRLATTIGASRVGDARTAPARGVARSAPAVAPPQARRVVRRRLRGSALERRDARADRGPDRGDEPSDAGGDEREPRLGGRDEVRAALAGCERDDAS